MEGLAKSSTVQSKPVEVSNIQLSSVPVTSYDGIPVDVLRMFGADWNTEKATMEQLKVISEWAFKGIETVGDGLTKLRDIERKVGMPRQGETRVGRLHDYIKIQRTIDDLIKRQDSLRGF